MLVGRRFEGFAPADLVHGEELGGGRESRNKLACRSSIHRKEVLPDILLCEAS